MGQIDKICDFLLCFRSESMDASAEKKRVQVPNALREVLLEFSIAYLLEKPNDVIDFAVDYFSKIQQHRPLKQTESQIGDDVSMQDSEQSEDEGMYYSSKAKQSVIRFCMTHSLHF